jgi:hypothetical protein
MEKHVARYLMESKSYIELSSILRCGRIGARTMGTRDSAISVRFRMAIYACLRID